MTSEKKKRNKLLIILIFVAGLIIVSGLSILFHYYRYIYKPNVETRGHKDQHLLIPTGSDFSNVKDILSREGFIHDMKAFDWVAQRKGYSVKVRPGRYLIRNGMSNNDLVNLLRSGIQDPVKLIFNNIRSNEDLAGRISRQLEIDSAGFLQMLQNRSFLHQFGVNPQTVFVLFIPNTYEIFWNTSPEKFFRRMKQEQIRFWNKERVEKADKMGLTVTQVVTLASIVEKETSKDKEKPVIAGVYINRLRKGWPLQADPTLIYAWNDYTIRRVLNEHKLINSPYNTYINKGLPPGPICLPSVSSIESVINYQNHQYMFFCSREDLSGYHNFSTTLAGHNRNAEKYHQALKKLKIY